MYPKFVRIDGKKVPIRTDWVNALKCFDIINDISISDTERTYALLYRMYGFIPKENIEEYVEKAALFLQCGETKEQQEEKVSDMDFNYDRKYINASFMSDYGIDLSKNKDMHFWQFVELIQGLTEKCILSRVRHIRTLDIKDYAEKDRPALIKAKEELALPVKLTKEEQEMDDFFEAQLRGEI